MTKKRIKLFALVLTAAFLCSCNSGTDSKSESESTPTAEKATTKEAVDEGSTTSQEQTAVETPLISWSNMRVDDTLLRLTEQQRTILQYYDDDYFYISCYDDGYEALQRYPKAYRGAQIEIGGVIKKILKSDDSEYTVLFQLCDTFVDEGFHEPMPNEGEKLLVIQGKQGSGRILEGDLLSFHGRYVDVQTFDIDGKSYQLPFVQSFTHAPASTSLKAPTELYTLEQITGVAKAIFGNDIKLTEPDYNTFEYGTMVLYNRYYIVTLDNQSNDNFSKFNLYTTSALLLDNRYTYDSEEDVVREIHVAPDFEHFIILQYDPGVKIAYLEYYDKSYQKVWGREFSGVDSHPLYDCTIHDFYVAANNDLYILDTATGKDKHSSTFVGPKLGINLLSDGVLLVSGDTKDNLMKVSADGDILWKANLNLAIGYCDSMQLIDQNMVLDLRGQYQGGDDAHGLAVVDPNGEILLETYVDADVPSSVPVAQKSESNQQYAADLMGKTVLEVLNGFDGQISVYSEEQCWFVLGNNVLIRTGSGFFGGNDCVNRIQVRGSAYAAPGAQNGASYDTLKTELSLGGVSSDNYYGRDMASGSLTYNGYQMNVEVLFDENLNAEYISLLCMDVTGTDPFSAQIPDAFGVVATEKDPLRMRDEPSTNSEIIMEISKGSVVNILGKENDWYFIEYNGNVGYVAAKFIGF